MTHICVSCGSQNAEYCEYLKSYHPTHCENCKNDLDHVHTFTFRVLESYIKTYGIIDMQLSNYNYFVTHGIQQCFANVPDIIVDRNDLPPNVKGKHVYKFVKAYVEPPEIINDNRKLVKLYPNQARSRNLDYMSGVYVDIETKSYKNNSLENVKVDKRKLICYIPTMVKSCVCNLYGKSQYDLVELEECPNDVGGYFIYNGNERVLIPQMHPKFDFIQVLEQPDINSCKHKYIADIRSFSSTRYSNLTQMQFPKDGGAVLISLPNIDPFPVGIIFKALGLETSEEIRSIINIKHKKAQLYISQIINDCSRISTRDDAMKFIATKLRYHSQKENQLSYTRQVVETELLPHLGIQATIKDKAIFLGYMLNKLLCTVIGIRKPDDRDNMVNKRVDSSAKLIEMLFEDVLSTTIKKLVVLLSKNQDIVSHLTKDPRKCMMTKNIEYCFKTGNWGIKNTKHVMAGVSQILERMTYTATLSHLRRVIITTGKDSKNEKIRQINTSQFGAVCPSETPEGEQCGIVMNFALLVKLSRNIPSYLIREVIMKECQYIKSDCENDGSFVFLNGSIIGKTQDPHEFITEFKDLRDDKQIHSEVSITYNDIDNEINIYSDGGRFMRPLLVVKDRSVYSGDTYDWDTLVEQGHIKYVDFVEIEQSVIASFRDDLDSDIEYDYCEIDNAATILGVCASTIPFPDHSQSPRNCYQSSMAKQALGIPLFTLNKRTDTTLHFLTCTQRPLVSPNSAHLLKLNEMTTGINVDVAVKPESWNQEDSVIINKSAIERGLFHIVTKSTITVKDERIEGKGYEQITCPSLDLQKTKLNYNYNYLHKTGPYTGIAKIGTPLKKDDVVVGKIYVNSKDTTEKRDISVVIKSDEEGVVDNIVLTTGENGLKIVKVVMRLYREPEVGDKFASRAAQKGTCGMVFAQEDMPFNKDGMVPDIIINPHCLPSRMTVNHIMEMALGKRCAIKGKFGNATPFTNSSVNIVEKICDELEECGFERHGCEIMYDPATGRKFACPIYTGIIYYQRLKHLVSNKMHARSTGVVTQLTRQPIEGRSKDGGLRFGEMERDCMIACGASRFLKERLYDVSDKFAVILCKNCGGICTSQTECKKCDTTDIKKVAIPYVFKLLYQELMAMNLKLELIPKDD